MSSTSRDNLTFPFPLCIPLLSFSCLIALTRISRIIQSGSDETRYTGLVPDFRETAFSASPFSVILTLGFSCTILILRDISFIPSFSSVLNLSGCWPLFNAFSVSFDIIP